MRPMFYDYPDDARCWEVDDQYMFGPDLLIAPVTAAGGVARDVWLPAGAWIDAWTGARVDGTATISCPTPIERMPVFVRAGAGVASVFKADAA